MKYYNIKNILSKNAQYNIIFGERSNGKTYSALNYCIEKYIKNNEQFAIIRRWADDFRGKRGATLFNALINNSVIDKLTDGKWTDVYYYSGRWFLCKLENDKRIIKDEPFAYAFALTGMEHDKSTSYPKIKNIIFDEFLTRDRYLSDEFVLYMNVLSTIIRERNDVKIFMLGNAVNKYSPYFSEMGLKNIKNMKPGEITVYEYGDSGLKVAVEFSDNPNKGKKSDIYFAFDNPKLSLITGKNGIWEIDIYPHCPIKFKPKDVQFVYFINFDGELLQCEIVCKDNNNFTYIHRKTSPIKNDKTDMIYSPENKPYPNYSRKITNPVNSLQKKIYFYFISEKIFYQDNEVGEIVRNYINWCKK